MLHDLFKEFNAKKRFTVNCYCGFHIKNLNCIRRRSWVSYLATLTTLSWFIMPYTNLWRHHLSPQASVAEEEAEVFANGKHKSHSGNVCVWLDFTARPILSVCFFIINPILLPKRIFVIFKWLVIKTSVIKKLNYHRNYQKQHFKKNRICHCYQDTFYSH